MYSPELQAKITLWRHKGANGTLTIEEAREAVLALRADRVSASVASEKSRARAAVKKADIPSADDLLAEMGGGSEDE